MALLEIDNLHIYYRTRRGIAKAVAGISIDLDEGRSLGLVGESGCGKSTLAQAIIRVMAKNALIAEGEIRFNGEDLVKCSESRMKAVRWREMALVPQAAMDSLNPVYTVMNQFVEVLTIKGGLKRKEARLRAEELFRRVSLGVHYLNKFPHEYSGGMKQRAVIAMALALNPKLLITDEPVTALDVIVQHQVLKELKGLMSELNVALIMITHDISVVAQTCEEIAVMYAGRIVERGLAAEVLKKPIHPYTMGLKNAFPNLKEPEKKLVAIEGSPPDLVDPAPGCLFARRCPFQLGVCRRDTPLPTEISPGHYSTCHRFGEIETLRRQAKEVETWQINQS